MVTIDRATIESGGAKFLAKKGVVGLCIDSPAGARDLPPGGKRVVGSGYILSVDSFKMGPI